jgi:ornithine carbamoyltransferase
MAAAKKDLITLLEFSTEEIQSLLEKAKELKANRTGGNPQSMLGRTGVLIFEKPSLRTRITFETAIYELGGHPINLDGNMVQMGKRETVEDVARNLQRWVHLLVVRTFLNETIEQLARHCSFPVINALSDNFHPCQALAFAMTAQEYYDRTSKLNVVFVGDGNNVCASLMIICAKLGYDFTLACPSGYALPVALVEECREISRQHNSSITITNDCNEAVRSASVIYTDVWASMGQEKEEKKREAIFSPYQINSALLSHAPAEVFVSHCLPAHRDKEITSELLDSKRSMAFDEAENRLHVQKAAIVQLTA